jgi:small conductance mechanosensitive channel
MRAAAESLRARADLSARILDGLEIAGVDQWADSSIMIKCRIKVVAGEQWLVRREFLKTLKLAFDAKGIEIPFPHRTVVNVPAAPLEGVKVGAGSHRADADGE